MSRSLVSLCVACAVLAGPGMSAAADFADPEWPCIQRKVGDLSPGLMWPGGTQDAPSIDAGAETALSDLADTLALRRVDEAGMDAAIASFVSAHGADPALMGEVFSRVFATLAGRRSRIMEGVADYSLGQIDRAGRIEEARQEMEAEMARDDPDFDRVDTLEEQLDWDQRIYTDRQQSLRYVCETPVLLEQRLYTIAQKLQAAAG